MEYPVYHGEKAVGGVSLVRDGLYYALSADCEDFSPGIWRVWGVNGLQAYCLGVLAPEEGRLRLRRRLSAHALPKLPKTFLAGRGEDGWLPWRGALTGEECCAGYVREDGSALAVPFSRELPLAVFEHAPELKPVTVCGKACVELPLRDGLS